MTEEDKRVSKLLCEEVKNYFFGTLKHTKFTAVQKCTIEYMINNYDCVDNPETCEINALIIAPSKELVDQIGKLAKPLCDALGFNLLRLVGGTKKSPEKLLQGKCVVIATPGRMEHLMEKMTEIKEYLKKLEVLIIDEADRFSAVEFQKNITSVLLCFQNKDVLDSILLLRQKK
uniref:ATP-dependent RNA helicase n=1 Tax=Ditylenchus dipsaci TaxID=166011 RepID=A0A915EQ80_9BILA